MCSLNSMFLSSLIEELGTKEENYKAGCTLTFGVQCIIHLISYFKCDFVTVNNLLT